MTPEQREALDAVRIHGSQQKAADALGIGRSTLRGRLNRAKQYLNAPEGQKAALEVSGLDVGTARHGWRVIRHNDGSRDSVFWKAEDSETSPEDVLEQISDRLDNIRPAPAIHRPEQTRSDIRNFLPLFDVHLSMRVGDYGTTQCVDRLKNGVTDILERAAPAECTIILNGGDFTEQNDPSNLTPQSKHPLAVDAEYDDTTDVATDVTAWMIEHALKKSDHVIYKPIKGNHDPNTARILRAALRQRYRNESRVTIDADGIDFFAHLWEGNFIAGHHGDLKKSPMEYVLGFAAKYPALWSGSVFRELWTGHLHHKKTPLSHDQTGMGFNQVRAIVPLGRYANENLLNSPSEMIGVTYRKGGGRLNELNHFFWNDT
ncbi:MAG: helix-turn-helix domain-containing protein [Pikeienuella sp.]